MLISLGSTAGIIDSQIVFNVIFAVIVHTYQLVRLYVLYPIISAHKCLLFSSVMIMQKPFVPKPATCDHDVAACL